MKLSGGRCNGNTDVLAFVWSNLPDCLEDGEMSVLFSAIMACLCMGAAMCGAGINFAMYGLIFSFFAVFGDTPVNEGE